VGEERGRRWGGVRAEVRRGMGEEQGRTGSKDTTGMKNE